MLQLPRAGSHTAHTRHTRAARQATTHSARTARTAHTTHSELKRGLHTTTPHSTPHRTRRHRLPNKKPANCSKATGSRRREGRGRAVRGGHGQTKRRSRRHMDTGSPVELQLSTITRPKCPRHTKNHDFRAGNCSGNCWYLKERESFLF